jgi:hypothetical protein
MLKKIYFSSGDSPKDSALATEYDMPPYQYSRQLSPSITVKGMGPHVTYLAIAPLLV